MTTINDSLSQSKSTLARRLDALSLQTVLRLIQYVQARRSRDALLQELLQARLASLTSAPATRDQDRTLTVPDVASELQLSEARVYELIRAGDIPAVRIGKRQVRVRRGDLAQYLAARSQKVQI